MTIIQWVAWFSGGIFFTSSVPHGVNGLMGLAKPPGFGLSSSSENVLWAALNMVVAWLLILRVGAFDLRDAHAVAALGLGVLMMSFTLARYFGKLPPDAGRTDRDGREGGLGGLELPRVCDDKFA